MCFLKYPTDFGTSVLLYVNIYDLIFQVFLIKEMFVLPGSDWARKWTQRAPPLSRCGRRGLKSWRRELREDCCSLQETETIWTPRNSHIRYYIQLMLCRSSSAVLPCLLNSSSSVLQWLSWSCRFMLHCLLCNSSSDVPHYFLFSSSVVLHYLLYGARSALQEFCHVVVEVVVSCVFVVVIALLLCSSNIVMQ